MFCTVNGCECQCQLIIKENYDDDDDRRTESSRSLSHLLMSFLYLFIPVRANLLHPHTSAKFIDHQLSYWLFTIHRSPAELLMMGMTHLVSRDAEATHTNLEMTSAHHLLFECVFIQNSAVARASRLSRCMDCVKVHSFWPVNGSVKCINEFYGVEPNHTTSLIYFCCMTLLVS